jgi:hypothetical protein
MAYKQTDLDNIEAAIRFAMRLMKMAAGFSCYFERNMATNEPSKITGRRGKNAHRDSLF